MGTRRCCCPGGCPPGTCLDFGMSNCSIESATNYRAFTLDEVLNRCCDTGFNEVEADYVLETGGSGCTWTYDAGCGIFTLVIYEESGIIKSTLTLQLYPGGETIVWVADSAYDPLCRSTFRYSALLSNPPDDCNWPRTMCVEGENECIGCCGEGDAYLIGYIMSVEGMDDGTCTCVDIAPVLVPLFDGTDICGCDFRGEFLFDPADTVDCDPPGSQGIPGEDTGIYWGIECTDGVVILTGEYAVISGDSANDYVRIRKEYPRGTLCEDMIVTSDVTTFGSGNYCDWSGARLTMTPVLGVREGCL